jgi:hypothetical protein
LPEHGVRIHGRVAVIEGGESGGRKQLLQLLSNRWWMSRHSGGPSGLNA